MQPGSAVGPELLVGAVHLDRASPGGLNRYTWELVNELLRFAPESGVVSSSAELRAAWGSRVIPAPPRLAAPGFGGNLRRLVWNQLSLPRLVRDAASRVFFSPVQEGMTRPPCPQVVTVHDLIPLRFPDANPRLRYYFRYVLPRILRASRAVVSVSRTTADDVRNLLGVEHPRVHVVYQGYAASVFWRRTGEETRAVRAVHGLDRDYVLAVGETRPYKNVARLIDAFARIADRNLQLVVVGRAHKGGEHLATGARAAGLGERVRFLGAVSDDALAALYSGARAFAMPSLAEGFGLPALEALACGCPVVASKAPALREVCGEAAEYVDAEDSEAIAAGLERVVHDQALRERLASQGAGRARLFSYRRAAEEIAAILRAAAA